MAGQTIEDDATIAEIVGRLNNAPEYVRRVLETMWDCKHERGNVSVKIGTTGEGRAPNYLIEYEREQGRKQGVYGAYYGHGHKKFENFDTSRRARLDPIADWTLRDEHWSTKAMSIEEVSALLGRLRGRGH